jgi:hypothetical protein
MLDNSMSLQFVCPLLQAMDTESLSVNLHALEAIRISVPGSSLAATSAANKKRMNCLLK